MRSGVVVMPAGRPGVVRRTYAAALESCSRADLELVVVSWSLGATAVLKGIGHDPMQLLREKLPGVVRSALGSRSGVVGRIDEHILVRPDTMSILLDNLDDQTDAVCAYPWDDPPVRRWRGQVSFGGCHMARDPQPFAEYSRWFPGWAASHRVDWVDAGAELVGPTRADEWHEAAATPVVQTLMAAPPASVVPLDYGEPPDVEPGLAGAIRHRLTRF